MSNNPRIQRFNDFTYYDYTESPSQRKKRKANLKKKEQRQREIDAAITRKFQKEHGELPGEQPRYLKKQKFFSVRVLLTGSREWEDWDVLESALKQALQDTDWREPPTLIHGGARGADKMADWFWRRKWRLPVEVHEAQWDRFGKRAGIIRNQVMVESGAALCLAFIKDKSRGATHCAGLAEGAGIPVRYYRD